MPVESKIGLVLGVVVIIVLAICFHSKEQTTPNVQQAISAETGRMTAAPGQSTSLRK